MDAFALDPKATDGFEVPRLLMPANPEAAKEPICAELCTKLGLAQGGRALLVVRPDGYVAIRHAGSWDTSAVKQAMQQIGLTL